MVAICLKGQGVLPLDVRDSRYREKFHTATVQIHTTNTYNTQIHTHIKYIQHSVAVWNFSLPFSDRLYVFDTYNRVLYVSDGRDQMCLLAEIICI